MTKIRVGLVGCGFVAELHMYAYKRVYGVDKWHKGDSPATKISDAQKGAISDLGK